jgi:hypothetical protein
MDTLDTYRMIIQAVLREYVRLPYAYGEIQNEVLFDGEADRYMVVSVGWQNAKRVHGCLIHIDIIQAKVWIQRDGTEAGIAQELVAQGIPKEKIVIGYQEPDIRQYTEFAVA